MDVPGRCVAGEASSALVGDWKENFTRQTDRIVRQVGIVICTQLYTSSNVEEQSDCRGERWMNQWRSLSVMVTVRLNIGSSEKATLGSFDNQPLKIALSLGKAKCDHNSAPYHMPS
jgi:hypothetical protein